MEETQEQLRARIEVLESVVIALIRKMGNKELTDAVVTDLRLRSETMSEDSPMFIAHKVMATNLT